jgi:hypothetical protein
MARIEDSADPQEEGIQIALDLIAELKGLKAIHGLHILAPGQEEVVPRLVKETGLRDRARRTKPFSGNGRGVARDGPAAYFNMPKLPDWLTFDPNKLPGTAHRSYLDL